MKLLGGQKDTIDLWSYSWPLAYAPLHISSKDGLMRQLRMGKVRFFKFIKNSLNVLLDIVLDVKSLNMWPFIIKSWLYK